MTALSQSLNLNSANFRTIKYGLDDIRKRSARIRLLRFSMLGLGIICASVFMGFAIISTFASKSQAQKEVVVGDALVLSKPRFIGHSSSGGKITITADQAARALGQADGVVELKLPHMISEEGADVSAKTGLWDQNKQELRLSQDVIMVYPTGDKVTSNSAYWGPENPLNAQAPKIETKEKPNIPVGAPQKEPTIKEAMQIGPSKLWLTQNVHFVRPSGETIDGQNAIWDGKIGRLSLFGNVIVSMKSGNATSQALTLDTNSRVVSGSGGVNITLPMGVATAQTYEYYPDTRRIILRGGARVVFNR